MTSHCKSTPELGGDYSAAAYPWDKSEVWYVHSANGRRWALLYLMMRPFDWHAMSIARYRVLNYLSRNGKLKAFREALRYPPE
jgi:hypothetical protein